jgi:hypothetical protein
MKKLDRYKILAFWFPVPQNVNLPHTYELYNTQNTTIYAWNMVWNTQVNELQKKKKKKKKKKLKIKTEKLLCTLWQGKHKYLHYSWQW